MIVGEATVVVSDDDDSALIIISLNSPAELVRRSSNDVLCLYSTTFSE